jgi:hypothetical protein
MEPIDNHPYQELRLHQLECMILTMIAVSFICYPDTLMSSILQFSFGVGGGFVFGLCVSQTAQQQGDSLDIALTRFFRLLAVSNALTSLYRDFPNTRQHQATAACAKPSDQRFAAQHSNEAGSEYLQLNHHGSTGLPEHQKRNPQTAGLSMYQVI